MRKKFFMAALSTAVVLGSTTVAFAADTDAKEPVVAYSFDDTTGMTFKGDAEVVANPDDAADKVLCVETGAGGANGNYALLSEGFLKDSGADFSNGVTVSMNVRPTANKTDWNYLFCLGASGTATDITTSGYAYLDGTIGFIARTGDPYNAYTPDKGWADGNTVNSDYAYFLNADNCNKWYKLTYVYSKENISIYLDGTLVASWTTAENSIDAILKSLPSEAAFVIGAGASRGDFENFGGYIDDVMIYNSALTAAEVAAIPAEVENDEDSLVASWDFSKGTTNTVTGKDDFTLTGAKVAEEATITEPVITDGKLVMDGTYGLKLATVPADGNFTIETTLSLDESQACTPIFFLVSSLDPQKWYSFGQGSNATILPGIWGKNEDADSDKQWTNIFSATELKAGEEYTIRWVVDNYKATVYVDNAKVAEGDLYDIITEDSELYLGVNAWDTPLKAKISTISIYNKAVAPKVVNPTPDPTEDPAEETGETETPSAEQGTTPKAAVDDKADKTSPKTGDVAPVVMLMVAALGAGVVVFTSKKRETR
jgi:hypothetical protein